MTDLHDPKVPDPGRGSSDRPERGSFEQPQPAIPTIVERDAGQSPETVRAASESSDEVGNDTDATHTPTLWHEQRLAATTWPAEEPLPGRARVIALFAAAAVISITFDRLLDNAYRMPSSTAMAILWAVLVVCSTGLFLGSARRQPLWWFVTASVAALLLRCVTFNGDSAGANGEYQLAALLLAAPALLMLHMQLGSGRFDPFRPAAMVRRWFAGWCIDPFSQLHNLLPSIRLAARPKSGGNKGERRHGLRSIGLGIAICIPVMVALIALLDSSDLVFAYLLRRLVGDINMATITFHALLIGVPVPLLFSLLLNVDRRSRTDSPVEPGLPPAAPEPRRGPIDTTVVMIVLGGVLALYAAFCAIQFTFLFAGHGLPNGYTYAQYAREGFFQLMVVVCINLVGFGIVLVYARRKAAITGMHIALVAATGIMLASSATRLGLYIGAFGLTWLRLLSFTFIVLLAVVLVLCLARMATAKLPLLTVCFVLVVLWFLALGWLNPSGFIDMYNATVERVAA